MSLSSTCLAHPCLKPIDSEVCHREEPLGVMGSISLCAADNSACQYYHPLPFGRYEPEDVLFPQSWDDLFAQKESRGKN